MTVPSADGFIINEKPGEFKARFIVRGEIVRTIVADSADQAREIAEAMADDDDFGTELDAVDDVGVEHVWKTPRMYLVLRGGAAMQVSRLEEGDVPRQPNEQGF